MKTIKLAKTFIFMLLVTNSLTSCMSEDGSPIFSPITRRSNLNLPPLSTSSSLDSELANVLESIQRAQREREQYIRRRDEVLPQLGSSLDRRSSNLVNTIDERFFSRHISLDDLADPADELDYLVSRLTIRGKLRGARRITHQQILRIGERFPNLRELSILSVELGNDGLRVLSEQPYAHRLTMLDISGNNITDEGIAALSRFTNLTSLTISNNTINDSGLQVLSELPFATQLTHLDISKTGITLNGLPHLNRFINLRSLHIRANKLGDLGLAMLAEQPVARSLTSLHIGGNRITAEGIQYLGSFTKLKELYIGGDKIGDAGVAALAQLPIASQLNTLYIYNTGITLQSLIANLNAFTNLTNLSIEANRLGNEALRIISELPFARNLNYLNILGNDITKEAWKKYKNVFKSLKIVAIETAARC